MPSIIAEISQSPRSHDVGAFVWKVAQQAAAARQTSLRPAFEPHREEAKVLRDACGFSLGNAIGAIEAAQPEASERKLLGALIAAHLGANPPEGVDNEDRLASHLLWLSGHCSLDAFAYLGETLGPKSAGIWGALGDVIRRVDKGRQPGFSRSDAFTAACALAVGGGDAGVTRQELLQSISDPGLRAALSPQSQASPMVAQGVQPPPAAEPVLDAGPRLQGDLHPAPRGAFVTTLMALSGWLLLRAGGRLFARLALARQTPAEVELADEGVKIRSKTVVLGKVMREKEQLLPYDQLVKAAREVRYPRLGLYAGLFALALGSYVGMSYLVDGVHALSLALLAKGFIVVILGVGIELAAATLIPAQKARCRLIFTPRKGSAVCVANVDISGADQQLRRLASRLKAASS